MTNLNIFTCCNGIYKNFIPLFIYSNLINTDDVFVEVGVDFDDISNLPSIEFLNNLFPNKFLIRTVNFGEYFVNGENILPMPNLVRFITEPLVKSNYVYISDVDIITLDTDITKKHINNITSNNLKYSNIVRDYTKDQKHKRLTGLHFTKYENYYPIYNYSEICKLGLFNHDEMFLYELMKKRHGEPNENVKWRPVHGIHVSPNRKPDGKINWGIDIWSKQWIIFRNDKKFKELELLMSDYIKDKLKIIDEF